MVAPTMTEGSQTAKIAANPPMNHRPVRMTIRPTFVTIADTQ
jgi:hypothetical protein